jgi:hypothetical protein
MVHELREDDEDVEEWKKPKSKQRDDGAAFLFNQPHTTSAETLNLNLSITIIITGTKRADCLPQAAVRQSSRPFLLCLL